MKMMIITFIAIYPLSALINYILGPALGSAHLFIRSLFVAFILVILMTYLGIPGYFDIKKIALPIKLFFFGS
jgi:antibiotic biosynthesis monooxygenase (ABM) superfamily enzyme